MPVRITDRVAAVISSPSCAVAAALALRFFLLWLSHHNEDLAHPRFQTVGLEASLIAYSLAAGKGFFGPYPTYQIITAWLAPVYPFLWAIGNKLFHLNSFGANLFAQLMNCAFSAATCWPIFSIGRRVFGRRIGLASAWLWVFLPYAVLLPLEWTWDQSLSALTLALVVDVTYRLSKSVTSSALTGYGLLWAFAALVNPSLCILMPFLLGWLLVRSGEALRPSLAAAAKVIFVFILAMMPWTIRNYFAIDGVVFVKSNFGLELWLGNNPQVKQIFTADRHPARDSMERIALVLNGEPNYNRAKQRQAIAYIEKYPRAFIKNVSARVLDTWSANYDSTQEAWILTLGLGRADVWFCSIFSILSFAGMIVALWVNWLESLPLAMGPILFPIPYYITHTASRYRHPIDPFMTILAVCAIAALLKNVSVPVSAESDRIQT